MKLTIYARHVRGLRVVTAKAVIPKSKKLGIPRKFQKTWSINTVAPNFAVEEMRPSFEAHAKRWEEKIMERIGRGEFKPSETSEAAQSQPAPPASTQPTGELAGMCL